MRSLSNGHTTMAFPTTNSQRRPGRPGQLY